MFLTPQLVWVENTQTKVNDLPEDIQVESLTWNTSQKDSETLFLNEVRRRRIANLLGEETIKYEPGDSELDDLTIEELLEYEV